jgi:hexosaminidase
MPGHSRAALAAYPQFSCTIEEQGVPGLWGVFDDIFCSKEESIHFLQDILDEVLVLFPSQYIHIGGDEAPKARWTKCKKCQAVMRENGIKDEHHLQSYFIQQMDQYLTKKGRKLIGWDEILEGGLSENAAVMSWRGFEGGIDAAKQQHFVVMSPGSHCYFDHYQSTNPGEPIAIGGYTPIEKVYDFNPIPEKLPASYHAYILGGQANLWTEYIPSMEKLEYMAYPRAIALSQALWCQEKPLFDEFKQAFRGFHITYLKYKNVNFSRALFYPSSKLVPTENGMKLYVKDEDKTQDFQLNYKIGDTGNYTSKTIHDFDSLSFIRTTGSVMEKITVELSSPLLKDPAKQVIYRHPALGLPIKMLTKPSPQYSSNGSLTLVDGVYGKLPWKGYEWLGFDTSTIEFIVDLQKKAEIDEARIHFLNDNNSWIYLPEKVEISVSKNGKKWSKPVALKKESITPEFILKQQLKGRFVKYSIQSISKIPVGSNGEGNTPWTFIDELILFFK